MSQMNYKEELNKRTSYIDTVIKNFLPVEEGYQKTIFEAMNYSILAGGKRIRPLLMLESYQLFCGTDLVKLEPFLAAIEMIHTYSLVHDDLPAMDDDEYRRGRKTTHVVFGEAMGILAGDGLLNYAFETASKAFSYDKVDYEKTARAIQILSEKSGVYGMVGGQVIDMERVASLEELSNTKTFETAKKLLNQMYMLKTSALIESSMMIGAILAGAEEAEWNIMKQIASDIGLAFQIQDDILDETSTTDVLGKPVHSDERNEKITYVTLLGIDNARLEVERLSHRALSALKSLGKKNEFLQELITKLISREK